MRYLIAIAIATCFALASCEHIVSPEAPSTPKLNRFAQDEYYPDTTFFVNNLTHVNLGWVQVTLSDSTHKWINVQDSGVYTAHITSTPAACAIAGQSLPATTSSWVMINQHLFVRADWSSNIVVIDESEQN